MITKKRLALFISVVLCLLLMGLVAVAQDGRIVRETVYSPSLEGNLFGDSPDRQVTIYLPPSYDNGLEMLYPVVYLLHGFTGNHNLWTGGSYISGNILNSMKSWLSSEKVEEMILVMPNSRNRLLGSMYTNSVATGNWADYIIRDLIPYIDSNYRTLPQRESRAVIGHAMGGSGGMTLGINYPDVFGCIGSMAGLLDVTQYPSSISTAYARGAKFKNLSDFDSQSMEIQIAIALSATFAPNLDNPPFYADFLWEYDDSNKLVKNQTVWDKFMVHDVLTRLSENVESLLNMRAIYMDCGISDSFNVIIDLRRVGDELQRLNIPHYYREFAGNHTCCVITSTGNALEVFSDAMAFEMLVSVEPAGKLAITWGQIKQAK